MNFYSMRELKTESKNMWKDLSRGDEVILTNNGKPSAIVLDIPDGEYDEVVQAVRQAKAMIALNKARQRAAREGFKTDDEIEALINEARGS